MGLRVRARMVALGAAVGLVLMAPGGAAASAATANVKGLRTAQWLIADAATP
jgi:hypothetical protein